MVGPSIVEAYDSEKPASISPMVIGMLQREFGFKGVVMSDDLDSQATMRDCTVEQVAIDALNAGSDYLLIAAIDCQLEQVVDAIGRAVEAAEKIRCLAKKYRL